MRRENKILFVDTETGGVNPGKHQLLSIGLAIWENGKISNELEILVHDKEYKVTNEALTINNINIKEHKLEALSSNKAYKKLINYIHENFQNEKITIAGHNIMFDVNFLKRFFKDNRDDYSKWFSHRIIDTSSILSFLYLSKVLDSNIHSSDKAFQHFKIFVNQRHSALGDAVGTAELFNKLLDLIESKIQSKVL